MSLLYQNNTFKFFLFSLGFIIQGCAVAGSVLVPLESIEPPSGKYNIGTQIYFWTDNARSEVYTTDPTDFRELMVQVWYPANKGEGYQKAPHVTFPKKAISSIARTAGLPTNFGKHGTRLVTSSVNNLSPIKNEKFPLVLFSHGDGGLLNQNTSQVEELVSNGYVVIACNHTYNASISFDSDGNPITYKQNVSWNEQAQHHKKYYTNLLINYRYQDLAFLLQTIKQDNFNDGSTNPFKEIIDFENVGAMGHSMGGGTTYIGMLKNKEIKALQEEEKKQISFRSCIVNILKHVEEKITLQRYKGLGEMNPDELWNTTLDPDKRNLLQVKYSSDKKKDQKIIHTLMGNDVSIRKDFIISNALEISNLDV